MKIKFSPTLLILLLASSAQAQTPTTPPDTGIDQVTVDLQHGSLSAVIPFDIPFLLTGTQPTASTPPTPNTSKISQIAGWWCELPIQKSEREPKLRQMQMDLLPGDQAHAAISKVCVEGSPQELLFPQVTDTGFSLYQNQRLPPNRNYAFVFQISRELSTTQLTTLENTVQTTLDQELRQLGPQTVTPPPRLSGADYARLLAKIHGILQNQPRNPTEGLHISPSNTGTRILDAAAQARESAGLPNILANQPWTKYFIDIWEAQIQRRIDLDDLFDVSGGRIEELRQHLEDLRTDPAAAALSTALETNKSQIEALLPGVSNAVNGLSFLVNLADSVDIAGIAQGNTALGATRVATPLTQPPPPPPPPSTQPPPPPTSPLLDDAWSAAQVTSRQQNLQATDQAVRDLAALIRLTSTMNTLKTDLGTHLSAVDALRQARLTPILTSVRRTLSSLNNLEGDLTRRDTALGELAGFVRQETSSFVSVLGSSGGNFLTRSRSLITVDLGLAYAGDIGEVLPVFGANFYTRPVNRGVPLSELGGFRRRFSFTLGVTVSSLSETANGAAGTSGSRTVIDDAFGSNSVILGVGLRITDTLRLSGGALIFKENDPNPLVDDLQLTATPFIAITFDRKLSTLLGPLATALGGSNP